MTSVNCHQCDKPALFQIGTHRFLCLDCFFKFSHIQQQELENNERMINMLSEQMAVSVGAPQLGPRFSPRAQPIIVAGAKLQNINVNNSVVGTINTGSIGNIDHSISALVRTGEPTLAEAIRALLEAILQSGDLTLNQRNELVESLSVISREVATPTEVRQKTAALTLIEKAMKVTAVANDITDVCRKWWPILLAAFGVAKAG